MLRIKGQGKGMKRRVHLIAAARPNFMKVAPLYHALDGQDWAEPRIVHTGQHYDANMSDAFFEDLGLPLPHVHLGVGGGSHAEQVGRVMMAYEPVLLDERPELVVVVGDVNATLACGLVVAKCRFDPPLSMADGRKRPRPLLAHLEAGLRSFDRDMPEEVNRILTDRLADELWTPSRDGDAHLLNEGVEEERIQRVGNIMIDSLEMLRGRIETAGVCRDHGLETGRYGVVTFHRPSNVDDPAILARLAELLVRVARDVPLVFPVHPRTRARLESAGLLSVLEGCSGLALLEPLSYIRFMNLVMNSRFVLTDSGGIQEETTYLGIPCLTLRPNTERPVTVLEGTNRLCSLDDVELRLADVLREPPAYPGPPEYWDGRTAGRIVSRIESLLLS